MAAAGEDPAGVDHEMMAADELPGHDDDADVRRSPLGGATASMPNSPELIGPVITKYGERFHMDLYCPGLHRSKKFRRTVCRACGLKRSIHRASTVFLDQAEKVHTDPNCAQIVGAREGCGRCSVCSALR